MVRQTSAQAYRNIKLNGLLTERRFEVYEFVYENGPCTAKDVVMGLDTDAVTRGSGTFNGRLSELREQGVVEEVGTTICPHSGQEVLLWNVTVLDTPTKYVRPPTKNQLLCKKIKHLQARLKYVRTVKVRRLKKKIRILKNG